MNHTPTPWTYDAGDSGDASVGMPAQPPAIYSDEFPICTLDDPCRRADRKPVDEYDECLDWSGSHEANAALIVRACNAHDELVAALQTIRDDYLTLDEMDVRRIANAALPKLNDKVQPANVTARMTPEQWEQFDLRR